MAERYLESALPEPVVCLGQRLTPFSVGHLHILTRLESSFVTGGVPTLGDLLLAVFVCAHDYQGGRAAIASGDSTKEIAKWVLSQGDFNPDPEHASFEKYLVDGCLSPELHETEGNQRMPGAPFIQRVRMVLQSKLGFTFEEAMNHPWGLALHDYFAFWELEGAVKIFSSEDQETVDAVLDDARPQEFWDAVARGETWAGEETKP